VARPRTRRGRVLDEIGVGEAIGKVVRELDGEDAIGEEDALSQHIWLIVP
jgi:hypothetical protein